MTEATIKIWVDGERYVRTAEGNGPVNALDTALRDAIGETYPHLRDIELVNFKVRILDETKGTGAITRVLLDASDGTETWGSIGVSENIIEASWEALVDSLEAGMLPGPHRALAPARPPRRRRRPRPVTARSRSRSRSSASARSELVLETLRSGRLSLGPMLLEFERRFAERLGARAGLGGLERHRRLHLAVRAAGIQPGDEVITTPVQLRRLGELPPLRGRHAGLLRHRRRTLNLDPAAAGAAVDSRTAAHPAGAHLRLPGRHAGLRAARGPQRLWLVEDACEALGAVHADGRLVGARGHQAVFAFYPNKQMTTGEGGIVACPTPAIKERIDSERNQGRAPDMGWLDHDRLGFNYRLSDLACALGVAQLERLDELLAGARARGRAATARRWPISRASSCPAPTRAAIAAAGSSTSCSCRAEVDRDATIEALRARGVDAKPYLPAIHLMSFYRQRFGHREGEFPVCEDVARRSLALPFFPQLTEGQIGAGQRGSSPGAGERLA